MKKVAIIGLSGNSMFYELDHLPLKGESVHAMSFHEEIGGKGFNQAVACKRLGLDVYYMSAIGNDKTKEETFKTLEKEGIICLLSEKEIPSANASILRSNTGDNEVIVYPGANSMLNLDDLEAFKKYIDLSDAVLLTYEINKAVLKEAIKYAKSKGKLVVLNPAPYIYDDIELINNSDIITPNEIEYEEMIKNVNLKLLKDKKIIITLGSIGAKVIENGNEEIIEGYKVKAVDTTGAGDVFNAGLLKSILEGKTLKESVKFANKVASLSVTKKYVLDSIPKIEEIGE